MLRRRCVPRYLAVSADLARSAFSPAAGGGEGRFAGGKFLTGMFFLKDGVTLRLDADATILGSPDYSDYPTNVPLKHLVNEKCPRGRATALIVADECRNVGIVGRGRIDCNGDSFVELARTREYGYTSNGSQVGEEVPGGLGDNWVNWKYRRKPGNSPPRMVLFAGCADVLVEDVAIVNPAGGWGYWVTDCDRVVFDRAKVLANPKDYEARANIMWAGTVAHNNVCGVGRAQEWSSHGIEHELSALYDCAHGAGLAVVMPAWMEYVMEADIARFARFAERVWDVREGSPEERAKEGVRRYRAWLKSIGMPQNFAELGAKESDIPALVEKLGLKGNTLGAFRPLNDADVTAILRIAAS